MLTSLYKFTANWLWALIGLWAKNQPADLAELIKTGQIKNVLVAELNFIGDKLFITPALRALKSNYPDLKITVLVNNELTKSILVGNPNIDEIIVAKPFFQLFLKALKAKKKYDLLIDFSANFYDAFLLSFAGIKYRIGTKPKQKIFFKKRDGFGWLYTHTQDFNENEYVVDYLLRLLQLLGIHDSNNQMAVCIDPQSELTVANSLKNHNLEPNNFIVFHPGVKDIGKAWDISDWQILTQKVCQELNSKVVFTGSADDQALIEKICQGQNPDLAINLAGQLNLIETAALIKASRLFVGLDTGTLHIAVSLNKPIIALFNKTRAENYLPAKNNIIVFSSQKKCQGHFLFNHLLANFNYLQEECLAITSPDTVFEAIKNLNSRY